MVLQADPDRLRQVLVNRIRNAVKYTPSSDTIRVSAESRDGGGRLRPHRPPPSLRLTRSRGTNR